MALSAGIVGLPNVGKSTLFNALTRSEQAAAANYAFCTVEPNTAVVPVPDSRLRALAAMVNPEKLVPATVTFTDIAGLVEGAHRGEGLGNQFLANIRETQAVVHVVRCFEDGNVTHVEGSVDPARDVEIIETELLLADLQTLEKRLGKLESQSRGDPSLKPVLEMARELAAHLDQGRPAASFEVPDHDEEKRFFADLWLLTAKPVIYCANVGEDNPAGDGAQVAALREHAEQRGAPVVVISAQLEQEVAGLGNEEQQEMLQGYGIESSGLDQVVHTAYSLLGLISFLTAGPKEVRGWTLKRGCTAPQAAGVIHTDFERGFIRAEVIAYDDYVKLGAEAGCRDAAKARVEGRDYIMQDGDVVHFRFNV